MLYPRLRKLGKWVVTPVYAIGSGVITTVAVSSLSFIAALSLPILIPTLAAIFLAESLVAIYLFKDSVPETLIAVFGSRDIFKNLSRNKKILLGVGMFSAIGGGLALAALTYTSGTVAVAAVLGLISISCPPIGIAVAGLLAVWAFVALSSLFIKWIANAIKTDIHKQVGQFFKKIFTRDPNVPFAQQALEGTFKILFTVSIVAVTILGTIATLGTMQKGLATFLSLVPHANKFACQLAASIISFGLMGTARLPLVMQSVCSVFANIGNAFGNTCYRAGAFLGIFSRQTNSTTSIPQEKTATAIPKDKSAATSLSKDKEALSPTIDKATLSIPDDKATKSISKNTSATDTAIKKIAAPSSITATTPIEAKPKGSWTTRITKGFTSAAKVFAVLIHGFSFGALAKSGGAAVLSNVATEAHITNSAVTAAEFGQTGSIVSGGLMSAGIAGFTLFPPATKPMAEPAPAPTLEGVTSHHLHCH